MITCTNSLQNGGFFLNRKFTYIYFALASLAAITFRLFLLIFSIDAKTGFIKDGYKEISIFMLALIFIALGLVFVFAFKLKPQVIKSTDSSSIVNKVVSFLFAISILFEILFSPLAKTLPPNYKPLDTILGLLSFGVIICSSFKKELKLKFSSLFNVILLVFFIFRLIGIFTIFSAFSMIVDIVFELLALCAMLIGFLFYTKCESLGFENINTSISFASFLFSGALGFTASIPKILLNLTGNSDYIHINSVPMYSVFFASAFLLLYSIEKYRSK